MYGDHFDPGTPDQEWLGEVGQRHWVVITRDERIRYRPNELRAYRMAKVRIFLLTAGNLTSDGIVQTLCQACKKMLKFLENHDGPFIAKILKNGKVKMWHDPRR